ncbi:InlB B-repeat-containing protein [Gehongia tenuis]|uniref:InlB B-repeat-containing protein n=1 Tax=Gehongia tenuis TaxID=2763655 RepID=A0A926D2T2_9FIRM|nr:InlB B-repeat-containing protein [Gehongia tenuis]MBC8530467.1 InlB B-repeat-containing protein [Gehongia tenuis]
MTKHKLRIHFLLLAALMIGSLLPATSFAYEITRVPLTLKISSYGAPFMNGSTGAHNVNSVTWTQYISKNAVGSLNASGSAEAYFVQENGVWWLYLDVEIGSYKQTFPKVCNAKITNKDMSEAGGNITFGLSFQHSGGTSTYISISGGQDLPKPEVTYTLTYDGKGGSGAPAPQSLTSATGSATFTVSSVQPTRDGYTFKGWSTAPDATDVQYMGLASITITKNTTLYAVWEKVPVPSPSETTSPSPSESIDPSSSPSPSGSTDPSSSPSPSGSTAPSPSPSEGAPGTPTPEMSPEVSPTPEVTPTPTPIVTPSSEATPVPTATPVVNTPQTGHDGNGFALIAAVVLLAAAAAVVIVRRRKIHKSN